MDRFRSILAVGHRGADAFTSYVQLQWIVFYAIIAFAAISMISVFIYVLSRLFGKIRFNKKQDRLHRELRAQIEERDELLQKADMKEQKLRSTMSNLQDRIDVLDNKLYRVDAMNTSIDELKKTTSMVMDDVKKLSTKKPEKKKPVRKVGRPRKSMSKAPRKK
jgi:septal ring factor EnvC (AmiA/AmiB activator)